MTTCLIAGPHLVERCQSPNSADFAAYEVVTHEPRRPQPAAPAFPPRDLRTCQDILRRAARLLEEWVRIGKADGIHGEQLRDVLEQRPPRDVLEGRP